MTAIFPYLGGKYNLSRKLVKLIPDHTCYVEAFGGAANLLLRKPKSKVEIYNDIDNALFDFFSLLQRPADFELFHYKLQITPYSRKVYESFLDTWHLQTEMEERVYRWYVCMSLSFGGKMGHGWGFAKSKCEARAFRGRIEKMPEFAERFLSVNIDCKPWESILKDYDSPDTFFYLDPPYAPSTRKAGRYRHEMTDADHERLVESVVGCRGKVMLSGYANPIYYRLPWRRLDFPVRCHVNGPSARGGTKAKRIESVWMNYGN